MLFENWLSLNDYILRHNDEVGKKHRFLSFDDYHKYAQFLELTHIYKAATRELSTKLIILDEDFQIKNEHNPIHNIQRRIKKISSLVEKLERKGLPVSAEAAQKHIMDIAGIRVVCKYIEDIYTMESLLLKQDDIKLLKRRDYILKPKRNGYKSLHIVVSISIFLTDQNTAIEVPVEVQLRTIGMDMWASLEHRLHYKNTKGCTKLYRDILKECADDIARIERKMQRVHLNIQQHDSTNYHSNEDELK
ncbi:GTP pyrophosphokinase [Staphylococcus felis]|uniref:GTP pyrophosphokinase n=1 Tax=Staphylococcus felis TaxID=46127 RepID=UPI0021D0B58A|nr:GTP pyrophosphokinase family protein [Staphylococcus felis]UXR87069.1 GTP pyrophosphokinase family protein [Staphylococcus felis]